VRDVSVISGESLLSNNAALSLGWEEGEKKRKKEKRKKKGKKPRIDKTPIWSSRQEI